MSPSFTSPVQNQPSSDLVVYFLNFACHLHDILPHCEFRCRQTWRECLNLHLPDHDMLDWGGVRKISQENIMQVMQVMQAFSYQKAPSSLSFSVRPSCPTWTTWFSSGQRGQLSSSRTSWAMYWARASWHHPASFN